MSRYHMDEEELDSRLPLLADPEPRLSRDDGRPVVASPAMSTVSTQSHEVKHILEPGAGLGDREADSGADYSHIHIRPKPRPSDGGYLVRPPPPAYHHRPDGNPPAHFHPPFQGSGFVSGSAPQRFRSPHQALSLEDVSNYELSRRKSWSPPLLRQNTAMYHGGQKSMRSCYSSSTVDWEVTPPSQVGVNPHAYLQAPPQGYRQGHLHPTHVQSRPQGHGQGHHQGHMQSHLEVLGGRSEAAENLPPRLAPVSGVPPEKLSRNLIRPIAFKPAYTRPPLKMCSQCGEDLSGCVCAVFPASSQYLLHNASHYSAQHASADPLCPRSPSVRSVDQSSVHSMGHGSHRSTGYGSEPVYLADDSPGVNVDYSPPRKASAAGSEVGGQTPSPSDSGVGELEAMLKEREAEIFTLRQVMDRNERAIFQVYEEKRSQWLVDMQHIREDYETKLKAQQLKATQLEQALAQQVQRLQQEKPHTQQEKATTQQEKPHMQQESPSTQQDKPHVLQEKGHAQQETANNTAMEKEHPHGNYANLHKEAAVPTPSQQGEGQSSEGDRAASRQTTSPRTPPSCTTGSLDLSVPEEMAMKNTEIMALRMQLQTLQSQLQEKEQQVADTLTQMDAQSEELRLVHDQLDQLSGVDGVSISEEGTQTLASRLEDDDDGAQRPAVVSDEEYTQSLERQIDSLREQLQATEATMESERVQWLEEKNKVIRYQKQLQLNYVQMQQKNKALEAEVEQLTLELESRHLKLAAMNGEESVC